MYVRWQSRKATHAHNQGRVHFNCALCESVWVDGKPRTRHIANLGGIRSDALEEPAALAHFWSNVDEALKPLKLSREDRDKVLQSLAKRVGKRPSREAVQTAKAKQDRALEKITKKFIEPGDE